MMIPPVWILDFLSYFVRYVIRYGLLCLFDSLAPLPPLSVSDIGPFELYVSVIAIAYLCTTKHSSCTRLVPCILYIQ